MKQVLCIGGANAHWLKVIRREDVLLLLFEDQKQAMEYLRQSCSGLQMPVDLILYTGTKDHHRSVYQFREALLREPVLSLIPFVVCARQPSWTMRRWFQRQEAAVYFENPPPLPAFQQRLSDLLHPARPFRRMRWRTPLWKRLFDLLGATLLLLLLLPVFLVVALLIRLESPGPVLYVSPRAGQGFRLFPFYKFRSMRTDADHLVDSLKQRNQYRAENPKNRDSFSQPAQSQDSSPLLMRDGGPVSEREYLLEQPNQGTFFKVVDDPRITRVGRFIRSTSIDELPQLFNVLLGHMSLVGNRPLPLYEAEQLTGDEWVLRFGAPAGITGLWQVMRRGQSDMSEEERKRLDLEYALRYSFWLDLWILWKTLPAAVQRVNV